jgi:hypothetical protein
VKPRYYLACRYAELTDGERDRLAVGALFIVAALAVFASAVLP